MEFKMHF